MRYFFKSGNKILGINKSGTVKDAKKIKFSKFCIGAYKYYNSLSWVEKSIDIEYLAMHLNLNFINNEDRILALSKVANEIGLDTSHPYENMGRGFSNLCIEKIFSAENLINQIEDNDLKYYKEFLIPRLYVIHEMESFIYNGEKTETKWLYEPTITGRFRVSPNQDFNPLVMKKEDRNLVKSKTDGHNIYQIDFKAIEFRMAMFEFGIKSIYKQEDPYTYISNLIGIECERSEIKNILISILYGKKIKNIKLDQEQKANLLIWYSNNISKNKKELISNCKEQIENRGFFINSYGRRVYEDNEASEQKIINNFFQSSAQDMIIREFSNFLQEHNDRSKIYPIFLLHDAMYLSIDKTYFDNFISKIKKLSDYHIDIALIN